MPRRCLWRAVLRRFIDMCGAAQKNTTPCEDYTRLRSCHRPNAIFIGYYALAPSTPLEAILSVLKCRYIARYPLLYGVGDVVTKKIFINFFPQHDCSWRIFYNFVYSLP